MNLESINPSTEGWLVSERKSHLEKLIEEMIDMDKVVQKSLVVLGSLILFGMCLIFVKSMYETKRKYDVMEKQILNGGVLGNEHHTAN